MSCHHQKCWYKGHSLKILSRLCRRQVGASVAMHVRRIISNPDVSLSLDRRHFGDLHVQPLHYEVIAIEAILRREQGTDQASPTEFPEP